MKQMTKEEAVTALFVIALYYWYNDDKFNARNALEVAVHIAKETGHDKAKDSGNRSATYGEILAFDFPAKRAASSF